MPLSYPDEFAAYARGDTHAIDLAQIPDFDRWRETHAGHFWMQRPALSAKTLVFSGSQ